MRKLSNTLYGDQRKLVRHLVLHGGTAKYKELGQHMGYEAQKLSGVLSAITRNTQSTTGNPRAQLVYWRIPEDQKREYHIAATALPLLKEAIASEQDPSQTQVE